MASKSQEKCENYSSVADRYKFVIVGDRGVGKTCLLVVQANRHLGLHHSVFPSHPDYIPDTEFRSVVPLPIQIDSGLQEALVVTWDTKGHSDYDHLRHLLYNKTDVFLICYSMNDFTSLTSVEERWIPQVRLHAPQTPFILIGTKADLTSEKQVDWTEGNALSQRIGASSFIECSAMTDHNVDQLFREAVVIAHNTRATLTKKAKKFKCHFPTFESSKPIQCNLL